MGLDISKEINIFPRSCFAFVFLFLLVLKAAFYNIQRVLEDVPNNDSDAERGVN